MSTRHESCFVASTVLDAIHKVHSNLLPVGSRIEPSPLVDEGLVLIYLSQLLEFGISPSCVAIPCVNLHGLLVVAWDEETVHVDWLGAE